MVLEDHVRKKRRLIPPVRAAMGENYSSFSWSLQIVPELFWMAVLVKELGLAHGVEVARQLGSAAAQVSKKDPKPLFATTSSFRKLSEDEKHELLSLVEEGTLSQLRNALGGLSVIWPKNPFSFLGLYSEDEPQVVLNHLTPVLEEMYDRRSRSATLAASTLACLGFDQDKIKVSEDVFQGNKSAFSDVEDYPRTDESERAGSFFRAMAPTIVLEKEKASGDAAWVEAFWGGLSTTGNCLGDFQEVPILPDVTEGISGFIAAFTHFVHNDLQARQDAWELNLERPQDRQVILALLARQATLALEIAGSPGIWNPNTAPILLRAMADVHITLVWLTQSPEERVPMFVRDGLGAIKLEIAHRREQMGKGDAAETEQQEPYVEHLEAWLQSQQLEFLTEVNLGSWSGKNTRVMAEEAGCTDFYNYVFQPFSAAVHSYWPHVGRLNVEYCKNPAHNFHLLPVIRAFEPDTHWCLLASRYLAKTLGALDLFLCRSDLPFSSYAVAKDALLPSSNGMTEED